MLPCSRDRLFALLLYIGFLPLLVFRRKKPLSSYLEIHRNQALVLFVFLALILLILFLLVSLLSYGMVYHRDIVESGPTEVWLLSFIRKLLIVWVVFWGYAVFRALRGSAVPVPYMSFFTRRRFLQRAGLAVVGFGWVALLVLIPITVFADSLVTGDVENGSVFMVYEDQNRFPRALFSLAMLPIAREAINRYGAGSVVLLPISSESIQAAVQHGVVVIIASHGTAKGLLLEKGYFTPADILPRKDETRLKFVYFAGCDSGTQRPAWEKALTPADVFLYDRLTPVIEHLWWFWTQGPRIVREVS
jgi:hypothetical protein